MIEKTEWEVVDAPAENKQQSPQQLLKTLLGPWWRWKLAGIVAFATVALVLFAAIAGVFLVLVVTSAVIFFGVRMVIRLMRRSHPTDVSLRSGK